MKKRLLIVIALALVFTLALTLAACGGSTEQNPDSGTPSTPDGGQTPETPDGGEQTPETPDEGETPVPPVTYTVTFETNGGSAVKAVTVDEGDAITPAPETTLEGYEFGGWYFSADLSDDSLVTFPYTPAGSTTLYAKWSKILTAADLYNEVFGEDYAFVSFEDGCNAFLASQGGERNLIAYQITNTEFVMYVDVNYKMWGREVSGLASYTYRGNNQSALYDFFQLSEEIKGKGSLANYSLSLIGDIHTTVGTNVYIETLTLLTNLKQTIEDNGDLISDFSGRGLITNTTTEIEFADFAAKFMPAGVTPIACYVGECGARNIDDRYFVEYFGIGYYCMVRITLVFIDDEGGIAVSQYTFIVRALNNHEASESIYNRLLNGNETTDYIISNIDTTTIENPIWTGYTVGVTK